MIYDCFSFFNELDILEIRLNVLDSVVDKFVLVEAVRRHSGEPKELFFEQNKERYNKFKDKIIHIVVDDEPDLPNNCPKLIAAWAYENHQRNAIVRGLTDVKDDDTIIISDLDEIPDPKLVIRHVDDSGVLGFDHYSFYYYLNFMCMSNPHWHGSKMLKWGTFRDESRFKGMPSIIPMPDFVNSGSTATRVRFLKPDRWVRGGWHFSYYGGVEQIQLKIKSIVENVCDSARNISVEDIKKQIAKGEDPLGRGCRFYAIPLDVRYPEYIRDNKDKYADGILICEHVSINTKLRSFIVRGKTIAIDLVGAYIPNWIKPTIYAIYRRVVKNPIPMMKDQLAQ